MKKTLLLLIVVVMSIMAITSCNFFNNGEDDYYPYLSFYNGYYDQYGGGHCEVRLNEYFTGEIPEDIVIPKTDYFGNPVTNISYGAFENCTNIKSITLPDTITYIYEKAFAGCTSLTSINIPDSVKYIGGDENRYNVAGAFEGCTALTDISIGNSTIEICENAFYNTGYYNDFGNWDNDVLYIGNHLIRALYLIEGEYKIKDGTIDVAARAFYNCNSLTSVEIPESVSVINSGAFMWSGLTSVSFAENCKIATINRQVFWDSKITSIEIPDSVTEICDSAFRGCYELTNVSFGENSKLTTIGVEAFWECDSLSDIAIPESVTTIDDFAFERSVLSSITIPKSVKELGKGVFAGCKNLTSITVASDNKYFRVIEGDLYSRDGKTLVQYCPGKTDSWVRISNTVTKIGDGAFASCDYIESVEIPYGVTSIGEFAFSGCSNLASIHIADTVTSIGYSAFEACNKLTSLKLPSGITAIESSIFPLSYNLESIIIPKTVTKINANCLQKGDNEYPVIYYTGSEDEWKAIEWTDNESLPDNVTVHYNYVPEN